MRLNMEGKYLFAFYLFSFLISRLSASHKLGAKSEMHQTASKEIRGSLEGVGE